MKFSSYFLIILIVFSLAQACKNNVHPPEQTQETASINNLETPPPAQPLPEEFKAYWYANTAEISVFKLNQARYGEMREGNAVLVFVTEPFLTDQQVKADKTSDNSSSVLKLNATKNFNTGIYPYSIMQSVFYPVANNQHALKISCSVQEWCGQVYMQLNNRSEFEVGLHSYFEGEADKNFNLDQAILENELWTQLRLDPTSLPTGDLEIIPAFEFLRLQHIPLKTYSAHATLTHDLYTITYPDLNRELSITFNPNFPYDILSWEETISHGQDANPKTMTTTATRQKLTLSDYWNKNTNADLALREKLGLN